MLRYTVTENTGRREVFESDELSDAISFGRNHAHDNGVQVAVFDAERAEPYAVRMIWPDGMVEVG